MKNASGLFAIFLLADISGYVMVQKSSSWKAPQVCGTRTDVLKWAEVLSSIENCARLLCKTHQDFECRLTILEAMSSYDLSASQTADMLSSPSLTGWKCPIVGVRRMLRPMNVYHLHPISLHWSFQNVTLPHLISMNDHISRRICCWLTMMWDWAKRVILSSHCEVHSSNQPLMLCVVIC